MDQTQKSESLLTMGLLTFSGGFQDANPCRTKISLACTGNYRAMAESLVLWAQTRKKAYLIRSGVYLLILGLFFAGVCFSVLVQYGMGRYTIWIGCGILLFVLVWMSF